MTVTNSSEDVVYFDANFLPNAKDIIEQRISASQVMQWMQLQIIAPTDFAAASAKDGLTIKLGFDETHLGNVMIRALHGGVVGQMMQASAELLSLALLPKTEDALPGAEVISLHTNYLRSAKDQDVLATAKMVKMGRRVCFAEVTAWQENEAKPIARAAIALRVR